MLFRVVRIGSGFSPVSRRLRTDFREVPYPRRADLRHARAIRVRHPAHARLREPEPDHADAVAGTGPGAGPVRGGSEERSDPLRVPAAIVCFR